MVMAASCRCSKSSLSSVPGSILAGSEVWLRGTRGLLLAIESSVGRSGGCKDESTKAGRALGSVVSAGAWISLETSSEEGPGGDVEDEASWINRIIPLWVLRWCVISRASWV